MNIDWDGEGLPPVGMVCEMSSAGGDWFQVCVKFIGESLAVVTCGKHERCWDMNNIVFRPVRTPEQIAAEECDKAVKTMLAEFEHTGSLTSYYEVCEVLHKAGYRKQVAP